MKKMFYLALLTSLTISFNTLSNSKSLGFIAPWVSSTSDVSYPEEGEIVYDHNTEKLYFKNSSEWVDLTLGILPSITSNSGKILAVNADASSTEWIDKPQTVYLYESQASGTGGGNFNSGSWYTRQLNTQDGNASFLSFDNANDRFTLSAGTYEIEIDAPAIRVEQHKARLYDFSNSTAIKLGSNAFSLNTGSTTISRIVHTWTISESTTYRIEHYCTNSYANGFGFANSIPNTNEIYTQVKITKIQ